MRSDMNVARSVGRDGLEDEAFVVVVVVVDEGDEDESDDESEDEARSDAHGGSGMVAGLWAPMVSLEVVLAMSYSSWSVSVDEEDVPLLPGVRSLFVYRAGPLFGVGCLGTVSTSSWRLSIISSLAAESVRMARRSFADDPDPLDDEVPSLGDEPDPLDDEPLSLEDALVSVDEELASSEADSDAFLLSASSFSSLMLFWTLSSANGSMA